MRSSQRLRALTCICMLVRSADDMYCSCRGHAQHKVNTGLAWHAPLQLGAPVDELDDLLHQPQHRLQAPNQAPEPALLCLPDLMRI